MKTNSNEICSMATTPRTLCSAAWTDINIDFSKRKLRHCCKSKWEHFPDIINASFINASPQILSRRNDLLHNVENPDCDSCWEDYKIGKSAYRDHKNTWTSVAHVSDQLKYVELMFDNLCNMSCIYCSSNFSSRIAKENDEPVVSAVTNQNDIDNFIQWLTGLCDDQQKPFTICFLGGEITLSQNFYRFFEILCGNEKLRQSRLHLSFLTNGNTPRPLLLKFFKTLDSFPTHWTFDIGISNETFGNLSEVVRWGLDWNLFEENFISYLKHPKIKDLTLSPTPCLFTVGSMCEYFEWAFLQFRTHGKKVNVVGNWVANSTLDPAYANKNLKANVASVYNLFLKNVDLFACQDQYRLSLKWLEALELRVGSAQSDYTEINSLLQKWQTQKGDRISILKSHLSFD